MKKKLAALLSAVLIATSVMPSYVMADSPTYTDAEEAYEDDSVIVVPMIYRTEDDYVVVNPPQTNAGGAQTYATGQTPADTGLYETQFTGRAAELYAALKKANISETSPSTTIRFTISSMDEAQEISDEVRDYYSTVMWAYQRDYPEKFLWTVNKVGYGGRYSDTWIEITMKYTVEDAFTTELGSSAKAKINSVVSGCNATNRYGKLKYYHDWLVNNSRYGYATGSDDAATAYYQHSAIGCLLKGGGVCESYAKSFKIFCARENIPCTIITGSNHAWNYVKMEDGNWYMVDCTFDDPVSSGDVLRYDYFLVSNNPEDSSHRNDGELLYPKTSTKAYDPNTSHTHSYGAYVVTKEATCAETGVETATCSCGDKITRTIAKTNNHSWDNGVVTKQPTETAEGVRTYTCSVCKQTKTESIPKLAHTHSYGAYVVTKEATCAETGVETATCSCGDKITRTIAKDASNHVGGTEVRNAKEATCAAEGYTGDTYCKGCSAKLSSGKSIAKTTNHAWDNGVVTKQPTETATGVRTYTCSVCKQTKTESIPRLDPTHTHAYDKEIVVKEPTCAETGLKQMRCACGEKGSEEVIPATGNHNFVDHVCTVCGKREMLPAPVIKSVTNGLKGVVVQWEAVEGADNYRIYRKKSGATSWSRVGDTTTLRFDDTTAESGTTYYYTVRPYDLETKTPTGNYNTTGKSVLFLKAGTPSSLSNTSTGITVKWAKITGAKGYYVYRKSGSDSYKRIAEVTSGSTVSYTDTSVKDKNGTAYTYTIRAYNGKTLGNYAGKTLTRLTGVTLSTLSNPSKGALKVTWKKQSKVTGYEIQYSTSSTFASGNKSVKVTSVSTLTKTIKSLKKGKTYYVRIRGYKTAGSRTDYSAWSGKKSLKLKK